MDDILSNETPGIVCYLDDILIYGQSEQECFDRVIKVLEIFHKYNVKIRKKKKSVLFTEEINYLGFHLSADGIRISEEKIKPILDSPWPTCATQLRSLLGMLSFSITDTYLTYQ